MTVSTNEITEFFRLVRAWLLSIQGIPSNVFRIWPAGQPSYPMVTIAIRNRTGSEHGAPAWLFVTEINVHASTPDAGDEIVDKIIEALANGQEGILSTLSSSMLTTVMFVPDEDNTVDESADDVYDSSGLTVFVQTIRVSTRIVKPSAGWSV